MMHRVNPMFMYALLFEADAKTPTERRLLRLHAWLFGGVAIVMTFSGYIVDSDAMWAKVVQGVGVAMLLVGFLMLVLSIALIAGRNAGRRGHLPQLVYVFGRVGLFIFLPAFVGLLLMFAYGWLFTDYL